MKRAGRTIPAVTADPRAEFAAAVRAGLSRAGQKELPSKYFYDEVGSVLFEVICVLPEYGLTRAEERLLRRHGAEVVERMPAPLSVAELGSGSGKKTRWILEPLARRQPTTYFPIDISATALAQCQRELGDIDAVRIVPWERSYLEGLREVAARRPAGEHLLVLFLGSTIGNFETPVAEEFLCAVRHSLIPGDGLLLGADLEKPVPQMIRSYDDPLGVTAAFNLNLLARINRELDANFLLAQFQHRARYNHQEHRIEMHLRSTREQTVTIRKAALTVRFQKGETIWTESSHKFRVAELVHLAERTGFCCAVQWVDSDWPFAQSLLIAS
ncbi:MAG: L-histidine N(alpha)-methyltransferase [Terriglobia bacterium]